MPVLRYALDPHGPRCQELAWEGQYDKFTIRLDEQVVGPVPSRQALAAGHRLLLPDGSTLIIKRVFGDRPNQVPSLRDGRLLPGLPSGLVTTLRRSYQFILLAACFHLAFGGVGLFSPARSGLAWVNVVLGAVYLGPGLLVRGRSVIVLILALVVLSLDTVSYQLVSRFTTGQTHRSILLLRILMLAALLPGVRAIRQLHLAAAALPAPKAG